jgi:hypothetical protein
MDNLALYPELIDYIYYYCDHFQTRAEALAVKTFRHDRPGLTGNAREMYKKMEWISDEPEVQKLIGKGFEKFKQDLVIRIFEDHKEELDLNLCPECFKIARTPLAKQCRFCFHKWH